MTDTTGDRGRYIEQQLMIKQTAARLHDEFAGTFNEETIERYIIDSGDKLDLDATVPNWLPLLIERFTRARLRAQLCRPYPERDNGL